VTIRSQGTSDYFACDHEGCTKTVSSAGGFSSQGWMTVEDTSRSNDEHRTDRHFCPEHKNEH
jgi:hypothetical protein